jgi:hypothetical protein
MTRKVDVGSVLSRTFNTYTSQFTLLIPAALVVFVPIGILMGLLTAVNPVVGLIGVVLLALGSVLYQGMVVEAARDMLDGRRDQTIGSLIGGAAPVVVPLLIAGFLVGLCTLVGLIGLIIGALFVYALFAVTAPAIVIERVGPIDAMSRSFNLVKEQYFPVLGVIVVVGLILIAANLVLTLIFAAIGDGAVASTVANVIAQTLLAPLGALAASILYFDLAGYAGAPAPQSAPAPAPVV